MRIHKLLQIFAYTQNALNYTPVICFRIKFDRDPQIWIDYVLYVLKDIMKKLNVLHTYAPLLPISYFRTYQWLAGDTAWPLVSPDSHFCHTKTTLELNKRIYCRIFQTYQDKSGTIHFKAVLYRVFYTLTDIADGGLTGNFRVTRPHWNYISRLSCHSKYPNRLQICGWVIYFEINFTWKQMSHVLIFDYRCWSDIEFIDETLLRSSASFAGCSKPSHSDVLKNENAVI